MKRFLSFLYILFAVSIFAQNARLGAAKPAKPSSLTNKAGSFINVNTPQYPQTNFSITQLVTNVLINGGSNCTTNVSNVTVSPNLAASNTNRSWGYFNKGTTNFPFNDGIVLMTGYAREAGNAFISNPLSETLNTGGDVNLATAIGVNNSRLTDATYIEFDFVPVTSQISFNYIFASEEYEANYACQYSDGFALLIKKVGDPNYTNLAILPAGGGPVTSTNIHGPLSSCPAVNAQYYAGNNFNSIETNFEGRTIPLQAVATVIPGQTYHFKMVLADYSPFSTDSTFDTGVFLQAGSFNIGVQLNDGSGNPLPANISICAGTSQLISANVTTPGATFQWFLNGNPISGATSSTYTATAGGSYTVEVLVPGSTCPGTAQITLNVIPNPVVQNATLSKCSATTTASFNLTTAQPNISTAPATFTYYANQADALAANGNFIVNPTAYTSGNATIYVVVATGNCKSIAQLQLNVNPIPATPTIATSSNILCAGGNVTLTSSAATGNLWSNGATTPSITVSSAGTYTLTVSNGNCTSSPASTTITAQADPNVQITGTLVFCTGGSSVLTASATGTGNTFAWSNGDTTASTTVTTAGNYTVTVTTTAGCTFTKTVVVQVDTPPNGQNATLVVCSTGSTGTFDLTTAQPSITTANGTTFSYYVNQADANAANANTIATPLSYTSGNAVIYVLIKKGTCSQVVQLTLSVTQAVVPTITASAPVICGNGSITLSSNFATGNVWSTGETTQTISVNTAGTYTLTYTATNCTSTPASITIIKNDDPNVQITGNLAFCAGTSTILTATATGTGNTFLWSNGATTAATTISTPGTYTVTVTTSGGCPFTNTVTVVQNPVPTTTNAAITKCSLTTTADFDLTSVQNTISTSQNITFSYYTTLADATAGAANFIVNPAQYNSPNAVIIYVRVSNGNCFKVAQIQLTVVETPTPVISQSAPAICAGSPVTLTSNYTIGNVWSTGATTQSITVSTGGTYSLVVNNGNCPSQSVSVVLVENPNPNVQISGVLSFCQGSTTTLTATSTGNGNTYLWSNGSTNTSITVNTPGTYSVTVTTPGGCPFTKTVTVTQEPIITINIAQPGQINCTTPTVTLNATTSVFQAGSTILWTAAAGGTIVSGANTLTPVVSSGGNYTLTITNTTGLLCSQQATITVVQNSIPPVITITTPKTKICAGETAILTFNGAQTYTVNGVAITGNTLSINPNSTTTYTVTGVGANGCPGNTTTITIIVVPAIVSTIKDIQFCKGLSGILDAGAGPNYTYLWSNGATTQTITVNTAGVYNVTINNGTCTKNFSATVSYTQVPIIDEVTYVNNTLNIIVKQPIPPNLEYSINGGIDWQNSPIFTNVLPNADYTIFVRVKGESCFASIQYYTFFVKNAITPNADGINDEIDFTGVSKYKDFSAVIYDRYGKEVFRATPNKPVWNGSYIKLNMPTASYWYQVSWVDPISNKVIQRNGWILLKNRN